MDWPAFSSQIAQEASPSQSASRKRANERTRLLKDTCHGYINLDPVLTSFIDTPQFQRLRYLKQLGLSSFVFPGGGHSRFEHSIGVAHLAGQMIERLQSVQPELNITEADIRCVKLAGLCHDLGHGPFSHTFDNVFIPTVRPELKWSHELASEHMLDFLVTDNHIDIDPAEVKLIKDLIRGDAADYSEKRFLFEIVANKQNSVDVDKFDYIARDSHHLGIQSAHDAARLINSCRVIDDAICYDYKEVYNVYELFHTRYSLHKRIYTHKACKAIEYMIVDAFLAAEPVMEISKKIDKMEDYLYCTDSILEEIERSKTPELARSREIISRIRRRDLYRMVDQQVVPGEYKQLWNNKSLTRELVAAQSPDLEPNDVIVDFSRVNFGMGMLNPVEHVKFFGKHNPNKAFYCSGEQISYLVPQRWEELVVRAYTTDPAKHGLVQTAFRALLKTLPTFSTTPPPTKSRRICTPDERAISENPFTTVPASYSSPTKVKRKSMDDPERSSKKKS